MILENQYLRREGDCMLKQKKGYILLETLVVVGVLSIVLVGMYSSFINMYSIFKERRTYDNTEFLYKTKVLREQLTMTADLGSSKIVTICNNNDASNKCENNSEYGSIFEEFGIQYAFFAVANITSGDVNGMTNIPVTVKRYIRDLDTDADSNDVILIVGYQTDEIGYEVASINYSKTTGKKMSEFDKSLSGLDSSSTDVVTKPSPEGETCTNTVAFDGTADNNLRYVGERPCNYVKFDGQAEDWRIIGVMNNVDDGTGKKETRIKLVRSSVLGYYSWDTGADYGLNEWSQADLMTELNGDYLNTSLTANTTWYNGAGDLIGNTKWHLGGVRMSGTSVSGTSSEFYEKERGTDVWGNTNGQVCETEYCPRSTTWTGKVALMYPSDFGFAVGSTVRNTCLEKNLQIFNEDSCYYNDWLKSSSWNWMLTPIVGSPVLAYRDKLTFDSTRNARGVYPVVYLKSWVRPVDGNGSWSNPYILGF